MDEKKPRRRGRYTYRVNTRLSEDHRLLLGRIRRINRLESNSAALRFLLDEVVATRETLLAGASR